VLTDVLDLELADHEDAVLHEAARHAGAPPIVTRDPKGSAQARLTLYAPEELAALSGRRARELASQEPLSNDLRIGCTRGLGGAAARSSPCGLQSRDNGCESDI
jgi:hypothetical protein